MGTLDPPSSRPAAMRPVVAEAGFPTRAGPSVAGARNAPAKEGVEARLRSPALVIGHGRTLDAEGAPQGTVAACAAAGSSDPHKSGDVAGVFLSAIDCGEAVPAAQVRRAADRGLVNGLDLLGFLTQNGRGAPRDLAEAVRLYREAAAKGRRTPRTPQIPATPETPKTPKTFKTR